MVRRPDFCDVSFGPGIQIGERVPIVDSHKSGNVGLLFPKSTAPIPPPTPQVPQEDRGHFSQPSVD
jgi:hypothetical protein